MNLEQRVREVLILLLQMSEEPNEVVQVLDAAERSSFIKALGALGEQANAMQSDAELLKLIDAIHLLVEDQPTLVSLLLPEGTAATQQSPLRSVSLIDHLATVESNAYAQARAPQIRNAIIECRTQLEAALKEVVEPKHKQGQEKKL